MKKLFAEFEAAKDSRAKQRIIHTTFLELEVHAQLEETLIYPAIRKKIDANKIMDEALEEHHVAHTLINELKRGVGNKGRYEAKFKVLGESIKHHVKEEEGTMFPEAEKAEIDWEGLSQKALKQKNAFIARTTKSSKRKSSTGRRSSKLRARHSKKAA